MKRLLALDQASRTTGWAVFNDTELIEFGHFTYTDTDMGVRLYKIKKKVLELVQKYEITEIAFEDIQMQNNVANNVKTFKSLAEVFGVLEEVCAENNIPYQIVFSGTWKAELNIKGRKREEQKKNAQAYASNTYSVNPTSDEADAICIGASIVNKKEPFDWSN